MIKQDQKTSFPKLIQDLRSKQAENPTKVRNKSYDTYIDNVNPIFRQKAGIKGSRNKDISDTAHKSIQQQETSPGGMFFLKIEHVGKIGVPIAEMAQR